MSQSLSSGPIQKVSFTEIPTPMHVPGSYQEIVKGYQNIGIFEMPARTLMIGGKTSAGTAVAATVVPNVTRPLDARALGGAGSHIDRMAARYLTPDNYVPMDIVCVADAGGGTAAVWTIVVSNLATAGGTTAFAIAGQRVSIGTIAGDGGNTTATELAAAINAADPPLPVTATFAITSGGGSPTGPGTVTLTARNAGTCGNDITIVQNPTRGDVTPPGLTFVTTQTVQGATNPSIAAALAAVANIWYTDIIIAWQDTTNIGLLNTECERRFNAMVHKDARGHVGVTGTLSQQISAAAATNARFIYFAAMQAPGSPPWEIAAAAGGVCARMLIADPARQLNEIALPGIVGSEVANLRTDAEKELLIDGGCSVFHTLQDKSVTMQRYVSTYTANAAGALDPAWRDVMTQAVASRIRYDWKSYFRSLYPRNKLAPDNSLAADNDPEIVTPNRARASWAARYFTYARRGWVVDEVNQTNLSSFWIDPDDPNTLQYRIPYTAIGNMIVDAGQIVMNVGGE